MRHTWKLYSLAALLALAPAVARAEDPELTPPKWFQKAQEKLEQTLQQSFQDVHREVEALKAENKLLKDEMNRLKEDRTRLERRMDALEGNRTKRSFYEGPPAPGFGTILIDNRNASWTAKVSINGVSYIVPPLSSHRVERVPAGPFAYSVVSSNAFGTMVVSLGATTRTLTADTEFPIIINPSWHMAPRVPGALCAPSTGPDRHPRRPRRLRQEQRRPGAGGAARLRVPRHRGDVSGRDAGRAARRSGPG
jgi:hypothetical protein